MHRVSVTVKSQCKKVACEGRADSAILFRDNAEGPGFARFQVAFQTLSQYPPGVPKSGFLSAG